jgi:small subunit ribosomal protein S2
VTERWLGGMLTNFTTIKKQIRGLRELERGQERARSTSTPRRSA